MSGANGSLQGYNLFAYCFNNPVNMTDFEGNWPKWIETAAKVIAVAAVVVTATALVSVVAAGTGGLALGAASIAFGTACGGLVGGAANEKKGESFINGWLGGAANGLIQSAGSVALGCAGSILGGGIGSGIGTTIIDMLNNIDKPSEQQKSQEDIIDDSLKSAMVGTVMSGLTAGIGKGLDFSINSPYGYNSLGINMGIASITPAFAQALKCFYGCIDDAMVYVICE